MTFVKSYWLFIVVLLLVGFSTVVVTWNPADDAYDQLYGDLPTMTVEELAAFSGEDGGPIYVGMNGYVYDVSASAEYYAPGGRYDYLAGKDSSGLLAIAGGGIIKKKYQPVYKLVD